MCERAPRVLQQHTSVEFFTLWIHLFNFEDVVKNDAGL
jgi:hypothetical protein